MTDMSNYTTLVNGHGGEDGAPVIQPLTIPAASGLSSRWPLQPPQEEDTGADPAGRWQHALPGVRSYVLSAHRAWLAVIPIVLVNSVAFAGQLAFLRGHLPWPLAGQILVAVTLESVAVYLAWQAHLALAADDSAMRLRLAAYGFAAVIGVMNYSHYMAPGWRPTFAAVTFGLMSVSSPWLWSVHSRRMSRDALKAHGLIEPHAVRLGATRWIWHPWRSARVMWHATWEGENDPAKAIALVQVAGTDDGREDSPAPAPPSGKTADMDMDISQDKPLDIPAAKGPGKPKAATGTRKRTATGHDRATAMLRRNPGLSNAEVASRLGVSEKTVSRARAAAAPKGPEDPAGR